MEIVVIRYLQGQEGRDWPEYLPSNRADLSAITNVTVTMVGKFELSFLLVPLLELEPL